MCILVMCYNNTEWPTLSDISHIHLEPTGKLQFLAHLVYQLKSLIQSCFVHHRPASSPLVLASVHTPPAHS